MDIQTFLSAQSTGTLTLLVFLILWTLVWKGLALWRAASKRDILWFVILFVVNTFGILEILYLRIISKRQKSLPTPTSEV